MKTINLRDYYPYYAHDSFVDLPDEIIAVMKPYRPEFNRLLDDAKAHKFDIVLCKTQSRFTRELEMVEKYIDEHAAAIVREVFTLYANGSGRDPSSPTYSLLPI